jgi:hypothetical protein
MAACLILACCGVSAAGVKGKAAKEAAEYLLSKFGRETAEQSVETLSRKIELLAFKRGDDAITAVRKVGPRALRVIEESGEHGADAVRLMVRRGDDALWVVARKNRMAIFIKHGDDAADAMIRHGEIAESLIESMGTPAAAALRAISAQNGRRLAIMAEEGTMSRIGRSSELLEIVGKHGDRAMDFVCTNKGSLAVAGALAAFLADPEPFLDGAADITRIVAENAVKPLAEVPKELASEAVRRVNWTAVGVCAFLIISVLSAATRRVGGVFRSRPSVSTDASAVGQRAPGGSERRGDRPEDGSTRDT